MILIKHFKKLVYLYVLVGFTSAFCGSYEDFFKAMKVDDAVAIQRLLDRGFDPNTINEKGQYGLLIALREPAPKIAASLINAPTINLNLLNPQGESPLMLASLKGQLELAEKMVEKGADVNKTGWTPLHYAASTGQVKIIALLLENHAYIDAESPNGSTPLMMASMYGSPESVKLLIDEGADPLLKNQQGLTALQFARNANRVDAVELMTEAVRRQRPPGKW